MKPKFTFEKRDVLIVSGCVVFLLASLGAVGSGGRRRAKEAVCVSNLRRWGVIWKAFADDEVRDKSSGSLISSAGFFIDRHDAVWWLKTIIEHSPASRDPKLWLCPEATRTYWEGARNPFVAWEDYDKNERYYRGSYVLNLWLARNVYDGDEYWGTPYVRGAAEVPMMLDGQWKDMEPHVLDEPSPNEWDMWTPGPTNEMRRACVNRHSGVNAVFLDFSVRKVGLKELWVLKWHRNWPEDFPLPPWPEWMQNFKDP
jgi:hypothetical protein